MHDAPVALVGSQAIRADVDRLYATAAAAICKALPDAEVEHVGATSVEGLLTKGDLDILVAVERERFHDSLNQLRDLGWKTQDDTFSSDELQPMKHSDIGENVAIQLIEKGSRFEFFRSFRDDLAASAELRREYNQMKRSKAPAGMRQYRRTKKRVDRSTPFAKGAARLIADYDRGRVQRCRPRE